MKSYELPICIPQIYGYLHHAHKLSIVLKDDKNLPWFYSSYLQLYAAEYSDEFKIDFYSFDGKYPRHPNINENWFEKSFFLSMGLELLPFIIGCIDNGRYVEILMDEYYLSEKPAYQAWHAPHQSFIYGYDKDKETFQVLGFGKKSDYGKLEMKFSEVEEAFLQASTGGVGFFDCSTHHDYSNTYPEMNLPVITTYVADFLHSRNSFLSYQPDNAIYGLDTYTVLCNRLHETEEARNDIRPIHIFLEHAKCMINRLHYLQQYKYLSNLDELIEEYEDLAKNISKFKTLQLKYYWTRDGKLIEKITSGLLNANVRQKQAMTDLLAKLS